jgi:hypothetical protein
MFVLMKKQYSSDLTTTQWQVIEKYIKYERKSKWTADAVEL